MHWFYSLYYIFLNRCPKQTFKQYAVVQFPSQEAMLLCIPMTCSVWLSSISLETKEETVYIWREIYIYIYAFGKSFYPKQVTLHSRYTRMFYQFFTSLEIKPMTY